MRDLRETNDTNRSDVRPRAALVTGATRGLGAALVAALRAAGVPRVYAGYRHAAGRPLPPTAPGVVPLPLDVTRGDEIAAAAAAAGDVDFVVNNAGVLPRGGALSVSEQGLREAMEVNYLAPLLVARAFVPVLRRNAPPQGRATLVNVLSLMSFFVAPPFAAYSASKWAGRAMTEALAAELEDGPVRVVAAYPGGIDTDMLAGVPAVKAAAADVAAAIVAGALRGDREVFPDPESARARRQLGR